jgi:hypothetical protein
VWLAGPALATSQTTARIILLVLAITLLIAGCAAWNIWIFWYVLKYGDAKQKWKMFLGFVGLFSLGLLVAIALGVSMALSWAIGYSSALIFATCYYFAAVR